MLLQVSRIGIARQYFYKGDLIKCQYYHKLNSQNSKERQTFEYSPNRKLVEHELKQRPERKILPNRGIFDEQYECKLPGLITMLKGYVIKEEEEKINTEKVLIEHYRKCLENREGLVVIKGTH